MADDERTPLASPSPPSAKRRNAVLRLFDAPLYRDGLFLFMVAWAIFGAIAIVMEPPAGPNPVPMWLTALIGAVFWATLVGIVPAWGRLLIRRWLSTRSNRHRSRSRSAAGSQALAIIPSLDIDRAQQANVTPGSVETSRPDRSDHGRGASPSQSQPKSLKGPAIAAPDPARDEVAPSVSRTGPIVPPKLHWDRIDADNFERLLARLLEVSGWYVNITRLMNVNAPDAGRDIQAYRRVETGLSKVKFERVIVQAKHQPKRGISSTEIAELVYAKLPLWEGEPVRGLIIATTGSFTQDAVRWVESHNYDAKRPDITLWLPDELERLLRVWPAVLAEFTLID
ncbi:restriction endonuclease [Nocardia sp. NPDC004068]|uniref:restriction endonuclease n=1 Tax=Nocardia sp. NPDC004068 TaxID=3364303 RepID=UPI0036B9C6CD